MERKLVLLIMKERKEQNWVIYVLINPMAIKLPQEED